MCSWGLRLLYLKLNDSQIQMGKKNVKSQCHFSVGLPLWDSSTWKYSLFSGMPSALEMTSLHLLSQNVLFKVRKSDFLTSNLMLVFGDFYFRKLFWVLLYLKGLCPWTALSFAPSETYSSLVLPPVLCIWTPQVWPL